MKDTSKANSEFETVHRNAKTPNPNAAVLNRWAFAGARAIATTCKAGYTAVTGVVIIALLILLAPALSLSLNTTIALATLATMGLIFRVVEHFKPFP